MMHRILIVLCALIFAAAAATVSSRPSDASPCTDTCATNAYYDYWGSGSEHDDCYLSWGEYEGGTYGRVYQGPYCPYRACGYGVTIWFEKDDTECADCYIYVQAIGTGGGNYSIDENPQSFPDFASADCDEGITQWGYGNYEFIVHSSGIGEECKWSDDSWYLQVECPHPE